ncbi:hypothetical protein CH352_00865 [Leptospira hartskeerlii]|uniref:Uncharacterized protein n=1 Tax=Leptospira hartskeerlii TaxID=2023177 RepID=A0A2M9X8H1_9LEPT|nr:DUF4209 domain-containing protein [Leptospira hartskeerlii]PJZ23955.1 hypothetical protein CH357_18445 [Leptospira hartskeerlii]PJZ35219.1 hypothetical protein CH352_00865 [Leptospira hartskeerlii]
MRILSTKINDEVFQLEVSKEFSDNNHEIAIELFALAKIFHGKNEVFKEKLTNLVASIYYLYFQPLNSEKPYGENAEFIRTNEEFSYLTGEATIIHDTFLNARVNDLNWIFNRNHLGARSAIKSYLSIATSNNKIVRFPDEYFHRTLILSLSIGDMQQHSEVLTILKERTSSLIEEPGSYFLFRHIYVFLLFMKKEEPEVLDLIKINIRKAAKEKELDKELKYLELLEKYSQKITNPVLKKVSILLRARTCKKLADQTFKVTKSALTASRFMRDAVDYLNQIKLKSKIRGFYYNHMMRYQEEGLSEFVTISHTEDAPDLIAYARSLVKSDDKLLAIKGLIKLYQPPKHEESAKSVKEKLIDDPLQVLFGTTILDDRAKVRTSDDPIGNQTEFSDEELFPEIIKEYSFYQSFYGANLIPICLREINKKHHMDLNFLRSLIAKCPIIPTDQREIVVEALDAGFSLKMHVFTFLAIPIFENMLRFIMKLKGIPVVTQEPGGEKQKEITLDSILSHPEIDKVIMYDYILDLKALLTDENGYQLRHNVAHGFSGDKLSSSPYAYYFFLLFLFFIITSIDKLNNYLKTEALEQIIEPEIDDRS